MTSASVRKLTALCACLLFAGCSVMFIAPYDATTDRLLTDLSVKTYTAIAAADSRTLSVADRGKFYDESAGAVQTMLGRARCYDKNENEIKVLGDLDKEYANLKQLGLPPRTSVTYNLRSILSSLQLIELVKKRSSAFSSGLKKGS